MNTKTIETCACMVLTLLSDISLQSTELERSGGSRCGTLSLYEVARVLRPEDQAIARILDASPPPAGFSLTDLAELSHAAGLQLVPTIRLTGDELPVPSVAHWKSNHYVAILERDGEAYRVFDPAVGEIRMRSTAEINASASGRFLVPAWTLNKYLLPLDAAEAMGIHGGVLPPTLWAYDNGDEDCPKDEGKMPKKCDCENDGDDSMVCPGNLEDCSSCNLNLALAMAKWRVTEPNINLMISDTPLFYTTSHDDQLIFRLTFKQRNSRSDTNLFSVGNGWECNWLTYSQPDATDTNKARLYVPGGGTRDYVGAQLDVYSGTLMYDPHSGTFGRAPTITHPNGQSNLYSFIYTNNSGVIQSFISTKVLPDGRTIRFGYQITNSMCLLTNLVDPDGLTNYVRYQNSNLPNYITEVENPYGRKARLQYDSSGNLTNIIDMLDLTSSFKYDSQGLVTNLITGYGTTTFLATTNTYSGYDYGGNNLVNRSMLITEPNGGHQLFMMRGLANQLNSTNSAPLIPDTRPLPDTAPFANTLETNGLSKVNSFYWGPQQYAALSANFLTNSPDFNNLTTNDYNLARMKHWLFKGQANQNTVGIIPGLIRLPSPDGVTEGQLIWYDYAGKASGYNSNEGTNAAPCLIARILPDTTTQYVRTDRNYWRHPTQIVSTYSTVATNVYLRTNTMTYAANNIDRLEVRGPTNELLVAYGSYNAYHQPGVITNAVTNVTTVTYNDANHQIIRIQWPSGLTTTNIYFTSGATNLLQQTKDLETTNSISFTYDKGLVNTFTDARGLQVTLTWDALERLTNAVFPNGTIKLTYDKLDLSTFVDRLNNTNSFSYNLIRQMTQAVDPLGRTNIYSYCDCGSLTSTTDPLNRTTSFSYDTAGRRTNIVYPGGYAITNFYSQVGRLTNVTDNAGNSVTNWYSNQGLLTASSNAFGQVFSAIYDVKNRATNTVGSTGVAITQTYDLLNRLSTRTWPDNGVEKFFYSARGLTNYTDQLTNITHFYLNEASWLTKQVFLNSTSTPLETNRFEYHQSGDLLRLYDGKDQLTSWNYDEYGRVTNKVDAASITNFVYKYDANDRLTNRLDALSRQITNRYDAVGNLTNVIYAASTNQYAYDALNRLTNVADAVGTTVFAYDVNGLLGSEDGPWANDTVSYGYTTGWQRSSLTFQQPNATAWAQSYLYDSIRRLTNVVSPAGTFAYSYDAGLGGVTSASGLIKKLSLPGGSYITNTFDSVARLLSTSLKNSGGTNLNSHDYVYDLVGDRTKQTFKDNNYFDYTYDALGQLKTALGKESGGTSRLHEQFMYGYDYARNLNYRTNNALNQTFQPNNLNQLTNLTRSGTLTVAGTTTSAATNVTVNSLTADRYADNTFARTNFSLSDGNNTFTAIAQDSNGRKDTNAVTVNLPATPPFQYDSKGNLTGDGRRTFAYDDENQLSSVIVTNTGVGTTSTKTEFTYDGLFRRRIRKEFTWQNSTWAQTTEVRYIYDGRLVIQERDGNNLPLVTYTRGSDVSGSFQGGAGIGGLLARTDHTTITPTHAFYQADGNGNVTALANDKQLIVARYEFDPFGNILSKSGPLADVNTYRFSSQEHHQNSGLLLYLYRAYDPNLQRFVSRDPIEEFGGLNLYGFVGNNAVRRADLLGLGWFKTPTWVDRNGIPHYGPPPSEQPPENKDCTKSLLSEFGASMDYNFNGAGMEDLGRQITIAPAKGTAEACLTMCTGGGSRLAAGATELKTAEAVAAAAAKINKVETCLSRGFKSFKALKKFLGSPGEGNEWHHIVEQSKEWKFGAHAIHNVDNVIAIPAHLNARLNRLYGNPFPGITGPNQTIREWLDTKTLQQNYDFGRAALHFVSEGIW